MSDLTPAALQRLFLDVFETDTRGRTLLGYLERRFARGPVLEGGIDAVLKTYHRGGQRELLDHIHNQIEQAHQQGAEPTPTPEAKTE